MMSLSYRVCRLIRTLDDCLDYSRRRRPLRVDVQRQQEDWPGELDVFHQWAVRMTWEFPDRTVEIVQTYGWFPASQRPERVPAVAILAERRLRKDLDRMAGLPVTVAGESWTRTTAQGRCEHG